jgi:hypothetical protein
VGRRVAGPDQAITYRRLARVAACSSRLYVRGN